MRALRRFAATLTLLSAAACGQPETPAPTPSYQRVVDGRSGTALYAPQRFAIVTTAETSASGYLIEDAEHEMLGVVLLTNADRIGISGTAADDATRPAFVRQTLDAFEKRIVDNINLLLPLAQKEKNEWSITALFEGESVSRHGEAVAYGHYRLDFGSAWKPRSYDLLHYIGRRIGDLDWSSFPADRDRYFSPGERAIQFVITVHFHKQSSYFTGEGTPSRKATVGIAVVPQTRFASQWLDTLDDLVTLKTLGTVRDELISATETFTVERLGPPVDIVVSIDQNASMGEEKESVAAAVETLVARLVAEADYDVRLALVGIEDPAFALLNDNRRYVDLESADAVGAVRSGLTYLLRHAGTDKYQSNRQLERAVQAVGDPANADFRRPGAPLLLLTMTDRDEGSYSLDPTVPVERRSDFANAFAGWLREAGYTDWVAVYPTRAPCAYRDIVLSSTPGDRVAATGRAFGADYFDLCGAPFGRATERLMVRSAHRGARYQFRRTLPIPFLVQVQAGGRTLPADLASGFRYDVIGDRLLLSPSLTLPEETRIDVQYQTLHNPALR